MKYNIEFLNYSSIFSEKLFWKTIRIKNKFDSKRISNYINSDYEDSNYRKGFVI